MPRSKRKKFSRALFPTKTHHVNVLTFFIIMHFKRPLCTHHTFAYIYECIPKRALQSEPPASRGNPAPLNKLAREPIGTGDSHIVRLRMRASRRLPITITKSIEDPSHGVDKLRESRISPFSFNFPLSHSLTARSRPLFRLPISRARLFIIIFSLWRFLLSSRETGSQTESLPFPVYSHSYFRRVSFLSLSRERESASVGEKPL